MCLYGNKTSYRIFKLMLHLSQCKNPHYFRTAIQHDFTDDSLRHGISNCSQCITTGRGQLKCDGKRAETRFRLSAKRTSPFKSAGVSGQSTTGSRVVRISDINAGCTMFRGSVKGTGYPLHSSVSPSLPLPCVTACRHISTGVYDKQRVQVSSLNNRN